MKSFHFQNLESMRIIIFTMALILSLLSCQKESPDPMACEVNNFGSRCFENVTGSAMDVFIDGTFKFTLPAGGNQCVAQLSVGLHQYSAEQASTGKLWEGNFDVVQCSVRTLVFRP